MASDIYRYLNFNEIASFQDAAEQALIPAVNVVTV
jgi:aconitase B